jgi:glycosyltransferase involved in cell wall biosynthesis
MRVVTGFGDNPGTEIGLFVPDVVHVHNLFPNISTRWLLRVSAPVVATLHNFRPLCAAGTLYRGGQGCAQCPDGRPWAALANSCYRGSVSATLPLAVRNSRGVQADPLLSRAAKLVFLSPRSRDTFIQYGVDVSKCAIVPNFVRMDGLTGQQPGDCSTGRWMFAGRLSPEKGIVDLVASWPAGHRLDVYGDGPARAEAEHVAPPEVCFHGNVPQERIRAVLPEAAGLIIPSAWAEGLPGVYLEALAAGVPIVARAGNSVADDLELNRAGIVVPFSLTETELRAGLEQAVTQRAAIGRRAVSCFADEYSQRRWTERIEALYADVIGEYRATAS